MPFVDDQPVTGPLSLPESFDLNPPEPEAKGVWGTLGAAFRTENPIGSAIANYDGSEDEVDLEYRVWDDIQGTKYQDFSDRFVNDRSRGAVERTKAQIDRELEDRQTISAAGGWGVAASMGAAVLSPTSLLPGGAVVKGAKGVNIARSAANVGAAAGVAAAIDEIALHSTQETRTGEESTFAIGGSVILGGLLGSGAGALSRQAFARSAKTVEQIPENIQEINDGLRSVGAAENREDFTLRRENVLGALGKVGIARSDPILRGQLSPNVEARRATQQLVETPLQYSVNEQGQAFAPSVETRIKTRRNTELAQAHSYLERSFAEYAFDGPVGMVGRVSAPVVGRYRQLLGRTQKLNRDEFMNEVGLAAISGDRHPIPQVQKAAEEIRKSIFDRAKADATELGIFDEDLQLKNGESYFMRSYNVEKIIAHMGDGGADDFKVLLRDEYMQARADAQKRVELEREAEDAAKETDQLKQAIEAKTKSEPTWDEVLAGKDDLEIEADVEDTINSIIGLKPGEHSMRAAMSSPTRARVLDVATDKLVPWLETDMSVIMARYFNNIVPDIELTRTFGDTTMKEVRQKITDEGTRMLRRAKTPKERRKITAETEHRLSDLEGMKDRIRGVYGVPENPNSIWVRGGRVARTLTYTGYLGGMTLSALPDVAGLIGRNGIEAAFGPVTALTNPKRLGVAAKDASELGAAAEWFLNSRAMSMADVADEFGAGSRVERGVGSLGRGFGIATGMVPWNVGWKSVGGAFAGSRLTKAAVAVKEGNASKAQLLKLAENNIDPTMAARIADQVEKFGDRDGLLWLPQAGRWQDSEAFDAMRYAMNREMDLMIVTPGQDKPLSFSTEIGKFVSQFKSFVVSAHHRILLSGIQRADATVLAQFTTMVLLGRLVSNIKADVGGYDRKEGVALWEDAIDRAGLAGWLMEVHGIANALSGGKLSISGEVSSRFKSRSELAGLLGPGVDMLLGFGEGVSAMSRGEMSATDARKVMRPIPGNNLPYLMGLTKQVADSLADMR
jgi:hypothetical protein